MRRAAAPALALLLLTSGTARGADAGAARAFPVRMVKLGGPPGSPATRAHLEFCARAGFNAVWVYGTSAGSWAPRAAPQGPFLDPAFVELARWCRERGLRIFVSVNPPGDGGSAFVFSSREQQDRIRSFFRLLRRRCGVRDFVLSFDDQPLELQDVRDIAAYGRSSAPAHLDLARRVLPRPAGGGSAWLCGAVYSDWHLEDDDYAPYAGPFLRGLERIPSRVGIVWTGPDTISPAITAQDLAATRRALGGREILLYDNYPVNDDVDHEVLALVLGPLRARDPRIREQASVYLACPMLELGASRLPLLTTADFLKDPQSYDPDASWQRAIRSLAGPDPAALEALQTQALEWGGFVGTLNYHHAETATPRALAPELGNPALMATWSYTLKRYPERMAALRGLADSWFRDDVLAAMARRLAVARALPLVLELRALRSGAAERAQQILRRIQGEREAAGANANVRMALDRFLEAASILKLLEPESRREPAQP